MWHPRSYQPPDMQTQSHSTSASTFRYQLKSTPRTRPQRYLHKHCITLIPPIYPISPNTTAAICILEPRYCSQRILHIGAWTPHFPSNTTRRPTPREGNKMITSLYFRMLYLIFNNPLHQPSVTPNHSELFFFGFGNTRIYADAERRHIKVCFWYDDTVRLQPKPQRVVRQLKSQPHVIPVLEVPSHRYIPYIRAQYIHANHRT